MGTPQSGVVRTPPDMPTGKQEIGLPSAPSWSINGDNALNGTREGMFNEDAETIRYLKEQLRNALRELEGNTTIGTKLEEMRTTLASLTHILERTLQHSERKVRVQRVGSVARTSVTFKPLKKRQCCDRESAEVSCLEGILYTPRDETDAIASRIKEGIDAGHISQRMFHDIPQTNVIPPDDIDDIFLGGLKQRLEYLRYRDTTTAAYMGGVASVVALVFSLAALFVSIFKP